MRANIFCIILAVAAFATAGVVTVKYQDLQGVCQVAGQVDAVRGAAHDFDIEVAINDGFTTPTLDFNEDEDDFVEGDWLDGNRLFYEEEDDWSENDEDWFEGDLDVDVLGD